jgi:hypothetical protein
MMRLGTLTPLSTTRCLVRPQSLLVSHSPHASSLPHATWRPQLESPMRSILSATVTLSRGSEVVLLQARLGMELRPIRSRSSSGGRLSHRSSRGSSCSYAGNLPLTLLTMGFLSALPPIPRSLFSRPDLSVLLPSIHASMSPKMHKPTPHGSRRIKEVSKRGDIVGELL